jgi:acetyl esterase/lipase
MRRLGAGTVLIALFIGVLGHAHAAGVRYRDPVFRRLEITRNVAFGRAVNNRGKRQILRLDLYEPAGDNNAARPAVLWAFPSGFTEGSKTDPRIVFYAREFAKRGWVSASIDYRIRPPGTPGSPTRDDLIFQSLAGQEPPSMRDAQHDMQAAVRWFRANARRLRIDSRRIVAGGVSSGGNVALEASFNPNDPGNSGTPGFPSNLAAAIVVSAGSDFRRIEPGAPPIDMFHGTNDQTAPYFAAVLTCGATIALGNACELTTYPGGGHTLVEYQRDIAARSADFLCRWVLGGCA